MAANPMTATGTTSQRRSMGFLTAVGAAPAVPGGDGR